MNTDEVVSIEGNNSVTITVAARELTIPLPRLQRILKRPEFADQWQRIEHPTRTGTRMVTCISQDTVQHIRKYLYDKKIIGKKEQRRSIAMPQSVVETNVVWEALTQEMKARIEEQSGIISDLRRDKEEWQMEQKRLQESIFSLQFQLTELKGQIAALQDTHAAIQTRRQGFWERLRPMTKRE
jgi:hypothetical protein